MYTPGYATRTLLHRLYSISTTKMHTLAYAHCHTVICTVTCAPTPVDSSCNLLCDSQASYCRRLCSIHVCHMIPTARTILDQVTTTQVCTASEIVRPLSYPTGLSY